jgi:Phage integrase family.
MEPFMSLLRKLNITAPTGYSIGFHSFRVTLVTKLREAGYSSDIIRGLVGHTNKIQTEHYNRAAISIDVGKIKYG